MENSTIILTLIGMALVTFIPRLLPAWFLREKKLPPFLISWLKFVPVAVLAALLLPSLLIQDGKMNLSINNLYIWAALPAGYIAWKKKSLFGTVIVGMLVVAASRWFFGI